MTPDPMTGIATVLPDPVAFAIVCKTYGRDLRRAQRLVESIGRHNRENLPIVLIVPQADRAAFAAAFPGDSVRLHSDEEVVAAHPQAHDLDLLARYREMPGYRSQQVIKSEAWRLLGCPNYLCADADAVFLRDFGLRDFIAASGQPYTQLHQSKEYHLLAQDRGHPQVLSYFLRDSLLMKDRFGRTGPDYDFGPLPLVWSARVWDDLARRHLAPMGWTLWDAIDHIPIETRWYGEALLAFKSIPLEVIEPLFRVYHYDWHWALMKRLGETQATIAPHFLGVVYQSNWEFELDAAGARSLGSRLARRVQRWRRTRGL